MRRPYPDSFVEEVKRNFPCDGELHKLLDEGAVLPVGAILVQQGRMGLDLYDELQRSWNGCVTSRSWPLESLPEMATVKGGISARSS